MILREIEFYYPELRKYKIKETAKKFTTSKYIEKDRFNNDRCNYHWLILNQTECICNLVMKHWKPKVKGPFWKLQIQCFDKKDAFKKVEYPKGTIHVELCYFNYKEFFKADNLRKKIMTLDAIEKTVPKYLEEYNLPIEGFEAACEKVRKLEFVNEKRWARAISPERLIGEVIGVFDPLDYKFYFVVKDTKKNVILKKLFEAELPSAFFAFIGYSGKLEWTDLNTLVYTAPKQFVYTLNIKDDCKITKEHGSDNIVLVNGINCVTDEDRMLAHEINKEFSLNIMAKPFKRSNYFIKR